MHILRVLLTSIAASALLIFCGPLIAYGATTPNPTPSPSANLAQAESLAAKLCVNPPPVAQMAQGWTCAGKDLPSSSSVTASSSPSPEDPAPAPSYCNNEGCWYRESSTYAYFSQAGNYYFYNGTELGEQFMTVYWNLSGTKTSEYAVMSVNHTINYPEYDYQLSNGAKDVDGSTISTCPTHYGPSSISANTETTSTTCSLSDSANRDHNMFYDFSWEAPNGDDDGYYYSNARSIVAHYNGTLPATSFTFDSVSTLPADEAETGWSEP